MFAATLASIALFPRSAWATALPSGLQAELLLKVVPYERSLRSRVGDQIRTLVVPTGDDASRRWAAEVTSALSRADRLAGLPHSVAIAPYSGAADLANACRADRIGIVFLSVEAAADVDKLRAAFDGVNVLTVVPDADLVQRGIVLGLALVSGKPKLFFNIEQGRRQGIFMSADILKLMTVFQ
jgi:hypothetical protein